MLITKSTGLFLLIWLLSILLISGAALPAKAQAGTILTIVLRNSLGNPLEGVSTEILSYGWGLAMGQPFAIIARGETDKNGVVAFDNTPWPFSGYRVKFSPTDHTRPADTYFLSDSDNQYRGYPGITTGGVTETQKFVLSGRDGVAYNDISKEGQLPEFQRDPVGGLENPRVTVMPGKDFLASVAAATSTAEARGEPTPTIPPPAAASPRPGQIQSALTITPTPGAISTVATVNQTTQSVNTKSVSVESGLAVVTTPPVATASAGTRAATFTTPISAPVKPDVSTGSSSNLVVSVLLAVLGLTCLVLFWKFRFKIYSLIGIETVPKKKQPINSKIKSGGRK